MIAFSIAIVIALLGLLRFKPWQYFLATKNEAALSAARQNLSVGFLPVT
jgi:hypothetical protein